jgi:hypothetical protein
VETLQEESKKIEADFQEAVAWEVQQILKTHRMTPLGKPGLPPKPRTESGYPTIAAIREMFSKPVRRVIKAFRSDEIDAAELTKLFEQLLSVYGPSETGRAQAHRLAGLVTTRRASRTRQRTIPPRDIINGMVQVFFPGLSINEITAAARHGRPLSSTS